MRLGRPPAPAMLAVALAFSGAAALIYEVMWVRLLADLFGHTVYAIQVVLAVFFGGMAVGSALADRWTATGRALLRWYAGLELALAVAGVGLPHLIRVVTPLHDRLAPFAVEGAHALWFRLITTAVLLLVPTALMGATFPLLARWSATRAARERMVAAFYAANTIGGAVGAWCSAFLLVPRLGVSGTLAVAAAANLLAAAVTQAVSGGDAAGRDVPFDAPVPPAAPAADLPWRALLLLSGFVAIGLEVLWARALDQVLSGSVYTFATVLSVFLWGLALGAACYGKWGRRIAPVPMWVAVELALAYVAVGSLLVLRVVPGAAQAVSQFVGVGFLERGVVVESTLSGLVLLPPALLMGVAFPLALNAAQASGERLGSLVAANTVGAIAAPIVVGFWLLPRWGVAGSVTALAWLTLSIAISTWALTSARTRLSRPLLVLAVSMAALALAPRELGHAGAEGERLLDAREDPAATVAVVAGRVGQAPMLRVNNTYLMGGGPAVPYERRHGHLPMLWHSRPHRVLVLGVGTGDTLGAVSLHRPSRLLAVELVPGVLHLARRHFAAWNHHVLDNPAVEVLNGDALRAVRATPEKFDVIIGDLWHPWQSGAGSLYSLEHFAAARRALAAGGLYCQWLPLYQLSASVFRTITRTFLAAFPHAQAWLGNFGTAIPTLALVGSDSGVAFRWERWQATVTDSVLRADLDSAGLEHAAEVYAAYVAGSDDLERLAGSGPLNTRDRPVVEFRAPLTLFEDGFGLHNLAMAVRLNPQVQPPLSAWDASSAPSADEIDANTTAVREMILASVEMESGRGRSALELALQASRRSRGYAAPAGVLTALAWRLRQQWPSLAEQAFREALRVRPGWRPAELGLAQMREVSAG